MYHRNKNCRLRQQNHQKEISGNYENLRFKINTKKAVAENSSNLLSEPDSEADFTVWTEIKYCLIKAFDSVYGWTKGNGEQKRETMEGVTKRRQQRKIFGDKKESKIRCICC